MTKLEELKAADAAWAAADAAWVAYQDEADAAYDAYRAALADWAATDDAYIAALADLDTSSVQKVAYVTYYTARDAYEAELKKQEENSDDH
jgi:uncharacterized protein (DUF1800 family)